MLDKLCSPRSSTGILVAVQLRYSPPYMQINQRSNDDQFLLLALCGRMVQGHRESVARITQTIVQGEQQ